jgi:transcriptional regulator with XRE-family HTH domain
MVQAINASAYQALPKLLIEARQQSGFLQAQVAAQLQKPQSFVSKYESGDRRLDVIELMEILKVLGIDIHEFLNLLQTHIDEHHRLKPKR